VIAVSGELWLFASALGASTLGGMLGMAGGIFIVPILTMFFGIEIHAAIGASLVSVIASSCASAAPFLRGGLTNLRLAIVLEIATTLGAVSGVLAAGLVSARALFALFAVILVISAWQMQVGRRGPRVTVPVGEDHRDPLRLDGTYVDGGRCVAYCVRRVPLAMALMYGAGLISALLGIGSGVLKIPAMDSALRLPIKVSSATSSFMIGVTAAASAGAYFARGAIDPRIAGPVALGSVVGALLGARILMAVSSARLRMLFVVVLVVLAVQMVLAALGVDPVRGAR
jgi:uncharacterized protein